jgi:hypothetical protein
MSSFYIWNPRIATDSDQVECIVTGCDVPGIPRSEAFISFLLGELGVDAKPESWNVTWCRSNYYTDYRDEPDWQDVWQIAWRLVITMGRLVPPKRFKRPAVPWLEIDFTGEDWLKKPDHDLTCLVNADFGKEADLQTAREAILGDPGIREMQAQSGSGQPVFAYTRVLGKYYQLQIMLGRFADTFYENGADYAGRILEICRRHKGTTHTSERVK